jgi:signal transduction histidine kinase
VRDVIDNLLSNAIKYSQIGGRIDVVLERQHENVVIRVRDQGAGLSPEDLSRVFGRFQRLSAKPTGDELSTGLGLSIVKRIVDLHGGSVVAESPGLGLGATFTVTLPVQASTPTQKAIDIPAVVMR